MGWALSPQHAPLAAGVMAAAFSWSVNAFLARLCPKAGLVLAAAVEETSKTLLALFCGADIFFTHLVFGVIEGIWEGFSRDKGGRAAGILACITHAAFGLVCAGVWAKTGYIAAALAAGVLFHAAWNWTVLAFARKRS